MHIDTSKMLVGWLLHYTLWIVLYLNMYNVSFYILYSLSHRENASSYVVHQYYRLYWHLDSAHTHMDMESDMDWAILVLCLDETLDLCHNVDQNLLGATSQLVPSMENNPTTAGLVSS